jgi:hypothetical protein
VNGLIGVRVRLSANSGLWKGRSLALSETAVKHDSPPPSRPGNFRKWANEQRYPSYGLFMYASLQKRQNGDDALLPVQSTKSKSAVILEHAATLASALARYKHGSDGRRINTQPDATSLAIIATPICGKDTTRGIPRSRDTSPTWVSVHGTGRSAADSQGSACRRCTKLAQT